MMKKRVGKKKMDETTQRCLEDLIDEISGEREELQKKVTFLEETIAEKLGVIDELSTREDRIRKSWVEEVAQLHASLGQRPDPVALSAAKIEAWRDAFSILAGALQRERE